MTRSPAPRRALALIAAAYLAITLAYGVITPLFEAPDEHWHFFTAQYISETWRLPFVGPDEYDEWLSQEAAQPPLAYVLGALLIAPIDTSDAREQVWLNPFAQIGNAAAVTNLNLAVHGPWEAWPWQGYALAAHLLRTFSTLLGLGTLLCIYGTGRTLWPHAPQRALLATAVVAFLPQFNYLHAAVTNDTLIIFLCSAAVYQLTVIGKQLAVSGQRSAVSGQPSAVSRQPSAAPPPPITINHLPLTINQLLLLGVTIGLAALTKTAGILLLLYSVGFLGVLTLWWKREIVWQMAWRTAVFVILPALLIAGWLWVRNWLLYGDITATEPFIRIAGGDRGYTLWQVLGESNGLWLSLFAVFGWFNLRAPDWIYWTWSGMVAVAAIGALRQLRAPASSRTFPLIPLLLAGWPLAVYAGLLTFMMRTEAAQGRLLLPGVAPLALAVGYGLHRWGRAAWLAPALALATTLFSLLFVIRPAYALPPVVDALPPTAVSLQANLGDGLTLVGAEMETETAVPGDLVWLTLYWQASQPPTDAPEFKLELLGRDLENPVAALHSYHGRGLYPANLWSPDEIVADRFAVRLAQEVDAPVLARAFVRLVDAVDAQQGVAAGTVKIAPAAWPPMAEAMLAQIGEGIAITAVSAAPTQAQPGETITVNVTWQVNAPPERPLTTLIHLAQPGQPPLATGDSPPRQGSYPTQAWAQNEVISDPYTLTLPPDLPPGRYPLWIGMYDPETVQPLPVTVAGAVQADGRFLITTIEVASE